MLLLRSICLGGLLTIATNAVSTGRQGYGLVGYGISMYKPPCAYACKASIANPLDCDSDAQTHDMDDMNTTDSGAVVRRMMGMSLEAPTPICYANNELFLQTLAYCISTHCQDVEPWVLERWWVVNVAGRETVQPRPKMSYQDTLDTIVAAPSANVPADEMLETVALVAEDDYISSFNGDHTFEQHETLNSRYGLVVLLTGFIIPIGVSCLRWMPLPARFVSRVNALFIDPPLYGARHQLAVLNAAHVPTRGQAIFIAYLILINVVLSAVDYNPSTPNSWYATTPSQVANYIANRTGVLSAANMALLVLYAGRNNVLLWLTDWSHSTFLILHRWVGAISMIQACLHSAIYLQQYLVVNKSHSVEAKEPYWIWGIVSTLAMVLLIPASVYPFRRKLYEAFLATHIVLALLALLGYYYHVYERFGRQWGYETWIYIAFALWAFDRVLRVKRMVRNGVMTAVVTVIDEDYVRLDVPGCTATGHAYLYFPTLTWRLWENHPFSVASSMLPATTQSGEPMTPVMGRDIEKTPEQKVTTAGSGSDSESTPPDRALSSRSDFKNNATLFVRTHDGLTNKLRLRTTVPLLVESSYGHSLVHNQMSDLEKFPNLICIAGGVGITAVLPLLARHRGNRVLYWGVRNRTLVDAAADLLAGAAFTGLERHVCVGERLDLPRILHAELNDVKADKVAVVVSGPPSMADEVRTAVSELAGKKGAVVVKFVEESYSW